MLYSATVKIVGHSLYAVAVCSPEKLRVGTHLKELRALLIESQVWLVQKDQFQEAYQSAEFEGLTVGIFRTACLKYNLYWIDGEDIGKNPEYPSVCELILAGAVVLLIEVVRQGKGHRL